MPLLTVAVISSLVLVAVGSFNTSKISKGFQYGITTDFQLQQLSGEITHYDEILTMSARMSATTGDLSWKTRYDAYEPLLIEAIDKAIELAPTAYDLHAADINEANLKLIEMEVEAFDLVSQRQPRQALNVLFSEAYKTQKEIYGRGLRQWSDVLSKQITENLDQYGEGLALSSLFSMLSFWILTAAWVGLLSMVNRYIHRRQVAEKRLRQAKGQLEISHQELQTSEARVQQKAAKLEVTLKELQQAQVQMVQSEKMSSLGQLVAGVAHEINNPVNFIHANLDHIREYTSNLLSLVSKYQTHYPQTVPAIETEIEAIDLDFIEEDLPKVLDSMKVGTLRIRQIVLSLRNFSRSDEQGLKCVDIHEGLESTLMILQHRLKETTHQSAIEIERDYQTLPDVECYPGQLNQAFMNLLANAIDALDEASEQTSVRGRGRITLRTALIEHSGADWVEIGISDTGLGIPDDAQSHIFDAFYTTKPVGMGTGMGLSISHTVVTQRHRGYLSFTSTSGKGTEFIIQIPVISQAGTTEKVADVRNTATLHKLPAAV